MEHQHVYDAEGKQLCCTQEDRIYADAGATGLIGEHRTGDGQDHEGAPDHSHATGNTTFRLFIPPLSSLVLLLIALGFDHYLRPEWFAGWARLVWYALAYLPVGLPVIRDAIRSIVKGEVFSEFLLMSIATIGAFAIGEFPEGIAVMLFYAIGEVFQTLAVSRAKRNIKALLDQRPDEVTILREGRPMTMKAQGVGPGDVIQLKPGEKLALDGELLSDRAAFNTSALTGESRPDTKAKGDVVLAGMINLNTVSQVKVTTAYQDSKLSRILELVQNATSRKAPTELFIRKFARVYTPIVVALAAALCLLPYFFVQDYEFGTWLYRSLIFLVISCPCALVISIPLGYFGGIGAASRNGILFKGSNFLDVMATVRNIVMDKTGTLTEGVFKVQDVVFDPASDREAILRMVNALERHSSHPIATAVRDYVGDVDDTLRLTEIEEIAGQGLKAIVDGRQLLVGNFKLMDGFGIRYDIDQTNIVYTVIAIAYDGRFVGYITIADRIKDDAKAAIDGLKALNVTTTMLSGDKGTVVAYVAGQLGIDRAYGDLLPEDKIAKVQDIRSSNGSVAFVGDGVNDAPVIATSDAGIAMGGLGSDATIETADIVIQDDKPSRIPMAIRIGQRTKAVVWQNVTLAFVVKGIVLALGAGGIATMWEAVFADVGVALIAILNAVRIQRMEFRNVSTSR